jgi:hypothetical protein
MTRHAPLVIALAALLANAGVSLAGFSLAPTVVADASIPGNYLDAQQFAAGESRVPGTSLRQNVTAWRINSGQWNGQNLGGLSVVLIEQNVSEGQDGNKTVACYVSEYATPAQRDAVLAALQSSRPRLRDVSNIRLEPATIHIDTDSQTVVIHLGLIA